MPKDTNVIPVSKLVIGYRDLFPEAPIEDRLSLLEGVSRLDVMVELAGLNFRLKGSRSKFIDTDFKTQNRELFYFCGLNNDLYDAYAKRIDAFARSRASYIFTRQTCLYAMEELLQSELPVIDEFKMSDRLDSWEKILKYLLSVNSEITKMEKDNPEEPINFETLNPKMLPISELMLFSDPFYNVFRGYQFMQFLDSHPQTANYFKEYLHERFRIGYQRLTFEIYRMWMANKHPDQKFNFYYKINDEEETKNLFDELSKKHVTEETFKLLNLRKNPFFKAMEDIYILTDFSHLLDITYGQMINDFFFDKIKGKTKVDGSEFKMQDYKSIFGRFFESYVNSLLDYSFSRSKNYVIRTFDELLVKAPGEQRKEWGDIYIRNGGMVIFGEVKSTSIYDKEKFGGNVDTLYKNDRNKFFKDFGVDQLVTYIKDFRSHISLTDPTINSMKKIRICPVIVFNEKSFQAPLMAQIFNSRFSELMADYSERSVYVYPLTLLHISDLENIESTLHKKPSQLWEMLMANFSTGVKFIPPFYHTLNKNNIRANYKRIRGLVVDLLKDFG